MGYAKKQDHHFDRNLEMEFLAVQAMLPKILNLSHPLPNQIFYAINDYSNTNGF